MSWLWFFAFIVTFALATFDNFCNWMAILQQAGNLSAKRAFGMAMLWPLQSVKRVIHLVREVNRVAREEWRERQAAGK